MESEQAPQALPLKGINVRGHRLPRIDAMPSGSEDEGGLNLAQVVATLRRKIPIVLGVTTIVSSGALLRAMTSKPSYQSSFEILTKPVTVETQVLSSVPQTLSNREQRESTSSEKPIDETKLKLLKSPRLLNPIVQALQPTYPEITYDSLSKGLVVTPLPNSEILGVTFEDGNREKVKAVLDLVSQAYLKYSLEERLADVRQGMEFVDQQLPQIRSRVEMLQDQLQQFRQQNNLIDPESTSKILAEQTSVIEQQQLDAQVKLSEARALADDLKQQLAQEERRAISSSALSKNERYQELLKQLLEVELEIAKKSSTFRENAPQMEVLRSQSDNLKPLLEQEGDRTQAEASSAVRELEARNRILAQTEELLRQRVQRLSVVSRQYSDIQQELKIATDNLNQFLTKREALRIDAGQRKTPWQILTPPLEPQRSSGNMKQTGALGAVLGLLLGVGTALVLEKLSNVLRTPEDAAEIAKLPILGAIPFNSSLEDKQPALVKTTSAPEFATIVSQVHQKLGGLPSKQNPYISSPFLEAFRSLHTNIRLLNPDAILRSLVISSALAGDGKTTVALYLAQAAAALGQRVLLVDTDLRFPQLHTQLQLPNVYGLSTVVAAEIEFEQAIQQSPLEPNLFVLTAGHIPPDPTRLLSSKRMQQLMQQWEEFYDLVIYDTPPLLGLADAKLLTANTDGIILTVGLNRTKNTALIQTLEGLRLSSVTPLGIVANGFKNS
jgi:succinoglycan biosynthesis transport protein ExoP